MPSISEHQINGQPSPGQRPDLAIAWFNLTVKVKSSIFSSKKRVILSRLKGRLDFGTMVALMGPSGAGKTTLLRCINGKNRHLISSDTEFYVSKSETIRPCFVVQDSSEHLMMSLTARESLKYAALLKNRSLVSSGVKVDHDEIVNSVIEDLLLIDCADTAVRLCSGGEQKRLAIGLELTGVVKPNLFCIDEPTSGLDSNSSEQTMMCLQKLAHKHKLALVASIHQPSVDVLMLFDKLYVLARGGRLVFSDTPEAVRIYLFKANIKCEEWQVPIELLIKYASYQDKDLTKETKSNCKSLRKASSEADMSLREECQQHGKEFLGKFDDNSRRFHPKDFYYLLSREFKKTLIRDWKIQLVFALMCIFNAVSMVYIFPDKIGEDPDCPIDFDVENVTAVNRRVTNFLVGRQTGAEVNCKYILEAIVFQPLMFTLFVSFFIPNDIKNFFSEHQNRWYSTGSYYWAKCLIQLPTSLAITYIFYWIIYYGGSEPDMDHWYQGVWDMPERYQLYMLFATIFSITNLYMTIALSAIFSSVLGAMFVTNGVFINAMFFCGFYYPYKSLDQFHQSMHYLNPFRLTLNSILISLYGFERCESESLVLTYYDVNEDDIWLNFGYLSVWPFVWLLIGLLVLLKRAN